MPAVGSSINSSLGAPASASAARRRIAISKRCATLVGESTHAHTFEQRVGFGAFAIDRPRGNAAMFFSWASNAT
jgi:hypothetical protein